MNSTNISATPGSVEVKGYVRKRAQMALVRKEKLYALIDEASFDETGQDIGDILILDTISKAMADLAARTFKRSQSFASVEAWDPKVFRLTKTDRRKFLDATPSLDTHTWLELTVCEPGEGALTLMPVVLGTGADDLPQGSDDPTTILPKIRRVSGRNAEALDTLAMLAGLEESTEQAIQEEVDRALPKSEFQARVAVYDVGQANCNAVIDSDFQPLVYFDMGWPWSRYTTPPTKPDLLQQENPAPVLLSHWDFDHWSFALEKTGSNGNGLKVKNDALNRFWIARKPLVKEHKLGPSHIAFAIELLKKKKLLIWPENIPSIATYHIQLFACKPPIGSGLPNDRNNNGLAMLVLRATGNILLTGDADYSAITGHLQNKCATENLHGMVLPHHGGALKTPPPELPYGQYAHAVVSSHPANTYGHPRADELIKCMSAGWQLSFTMNAHITCGRTTIIPFGCTENCPGKQYNACRLEVYGVTKNWIGGVHVHCEALEKRLPTKKFQCQIKI
ncbi:hypothetical protein [Rhodoferax sp.]